MQQASHTAQTPQDTLQIMLKKYNEWYTVFQHKGKESQFDDTYAQVVSASIL